MKWGLIGYGRIARKFVENLAFCPSEELVAIASRTQSENIPEGVKLYSDYDELLRDPDIEIIYISTIHNLHCIHTIKALQAGKHVLCEKPLAVSQEQVLEMIGAAKNNDKFLMEAIWTRFLPAYKKCRELILNEKVIGELRHIQSNFSFYMNPSEPKERLVRKDLAGGAVWDVGVYSIALINDFFESEPCRLSAMSRKNDEGIEESASVHMEFDDGRQAEFHCGFDYLFPNHAVLVGTEGYILMEDFWKCESFKLVKNGKTTEFNIPFVSTGFYHEIMACANYIASGARESLEISWEDSFEIAALTDQVLEEIKAQ